MVAAANFSGNGSPLTGALGGRPLAIFALVAGALLAAPSVRASGFYVTAEAGYAMPVGLSLTRTNNGVPTNCDQWLGGYDLNGDGVDDVPLPVSQCAPRALPANANGIDRDNGFLAAVGVGYAKHRLRFELELSHQRHVGAIASLVVPGDPKQQEFTRRDEGARATWQSSVFANLHLDMPLTAGTKWTPYVGAGLGITEVKLHYVATSLRTGERDALVALGRNPNAAGALSRADAAVSDRMLGYQVLLGARYRFAERRALNLKLRYSDVFDDFTAAGNRWRVLRDHESTVAPGGAAVLYDIDASDFGAWSVSVGLVASLR